MSARYAITFVGCGTANYGAALEFQSSGLLRDAAETAIDVGIVREANVITCPSYKDYVGQPKVDALLASTGALRLHAPVETVAWDRVIPAGVERAVVNVGLDRWAPRLIVAEDLRRHAETTGRQIILIQIGLDRGEASVAAYGCLPADPCPACGHAVLPESQPCVVPDGRGGLLRGNLHAEARAAARWAVRIARGFLARGRACDLLNTRTNLYGIGDGGPGRLTRAVRRDPQCLGPHGGPDPIRWAIAPGDDHD